MKQLELTPPLLIITMGYPGAGKTFFARQFADQYNLIRISEDRLRSELFERPQFSRDEADIIKRLQVYMLEEAMRSGQVIVCEGLFLTLKERKAIYQLANQFGYQTLTVWLQTDAETAKQRSLSRDKRNPDNKYAFAIDVRTFEALRARLQRPHEKETSVVISGKHAYKSQCLTVLRKVASIYSADIAQQTTPRPVNDRRPLQNPRIAPRMVQ